MDISEVQTNDNTEVLLAELQTERSKFTKADDLYLHALVNRLIELKVYPPMGCYSLDPKTGESKGRYTAYQMMDAWGANWHIWEGPLNCPHCNSDLCNREAGTPFKREIGIYFNDRTQYYQCPDCGGHIPREMKKSFSVQHTQVEQK